VKLEGIIFFYIKKSRNKLEIQTISIKLKNIILVINLNWMTNKFFIKW
jgi:hypothetical protein